MEQRFGLGRGGGRLLVREEGLTASFEAEMADDKQGLYKLFIAGQGGNLLLGTFMPEGGRLTLRRAVPLAELRRRGVWPVTGGEARMSFSFGRDTPAVGWVRAENPARLMGDRLLSQAVYEQRGLLYRREEGGFSLAAPMERGRPFPMTPIFCFARLEKLPLGLYAIFCFNKHGCPIFRNEKKETGHTEDVNQERK